VPFVLRAADATSTVADVPALMERSTRGLSVWYIPGAEGASKATVDPELERNLRALGYIQ
jgi:hypothetical protein